MWSTSLPFILKENGSEPMMFGIITGFSSFAQMIGSIYGGPLIDRYGAKPALVVSFAASLLGYLIVFFTTSSSAILISRFVQLYS